MKRLVGIIIICFSLSAYGQKSFKSLEAAMLLPDSVEELTLSKKKLKEFPREILSFKNLKRLNLSNNKLDSIPDLSALTNLTYLNLEKNRLDTISPGILTAKNLEILMLGANYIRTLPKGLSELKNLRILDMWGNPITYYAFELKEMTALEIVDLSNVMYSKDEHKDLKEIFAHTKLIIDDPCDCLK